MTRLLACLCLSAWAAAIPEAKSVATEGLSAKQQRIVTIAAFTAIGDLRKLNTALNDGLDAGLTINEIKEVLVQMYAYAGFPRSLNGITTFMDVLAEREQKGIRDVVGAEPSPFPANRTSIELGAEIRERLIGGPATGRYITFAPAIDAFLKGHLFGDIFGRDNLDFQSREIATIGALAALGDVNPQLQSHFNVGLNTGLTEAQLRSLVSVIAAHVGKKQADNASAVLADVVRTRPAGGPRVVSMAPAAPPPTPAISISTDSSRRAYAAPAENFTGSAVVRPLFQRNDASRVSAASVTFEPAARTAWHDHPFGQRLIVTAGTGWVQQWGGPAQTMREGDVVSIPPGVKHWHGATATTSVTHIAVQEQRDGSSVRWMEKVSDEQYRARPNR
ncbi:MAG TPA: carboxymuconolactone decarboxylase family protein [Gemmatimonadales bacterium]|nr:carboxymuconolactone decarboxylase family protein [Gemmatimonadales bacterium]